MKHFMITFLFGYEKYGCATYKTHTLKEAKTQFRHEHADGYFYIIKIEIL